MGILKKNIYTPEMTAIDLDTYLGIPGQKVKCKETGNIHLMDGVTPGGFEVTDDNTLSIEEIKLVTDGLYKSTSDWSWKLLQSNSCRPYWEYVKESDIDDVYGGRFRADKYTYITDTLILPDDYIAGTDIDFYYSWFMDDDEEGSVVHGLNFKFIRDNEAYDDAILISKYWVESLLESDEGILKEVLYSTRYGLLDGSSLSPGDKLLFRVIRVGGHSYDTLDTESFILNCGFRYKGSN